MGLVVNLGDVLILEENNLVKVQKEIEYNGRNYLLLTSLVPDQMREAMFAVEKVGDENLSIDVVEDENLIKILTEICKK